MYLSRLHRKIGLRGFVNGATTLSITAFSITPFSITAFSITAFSIAAFSIQELFVILSMKGLFVALSIMTSTYLAISRLSIKGLYVMLNITVFGIMTFIIKGLFVILSMKDTRHTRH